MGLGATDADPDGGQTVTEPRRTRTIWKFPLLITPLQTVRLSCGSQLLTVDVQDGIPCLWAIVETDAPERDVAIRCRTTGETFDDHGSYSHHLGTALLRNGEWVYHFFSAHSTDAPILID